MFSSKYIQHAKTVGYCGTNNVNRLYNCSRGNRPINRSAEPEESNTGNDKGTAISTTSEPHEISDTADRQIPETKYIESSLFLC